jgi:hypothetical protein
VGALGGRPAGGPALGRVLRSARSGREDVSRSGTQVHHSSAATPFVKLAIHTAETWVTDAAIADSANRRQPVVGKMGGG